MRFFFLARLVLGVSTTDSVNKEDNSGEFRNEKFLQILKVSSSLCENKAILYGGIVGGAVLLILIVIAVVCVLRRRGRGGGGDASKQNNNKGSSKMGLL